MIKILLKFLMQCHQLHRFKKKAVFQGRNYLVNYTGKISLCDHSIKEDITICDHVQIYGTIISQSRGKIIIGNYVTIGRNAKIQCCDKVVIEDHVIISEGVSIVDSNNHPLSPEFRKMQSMTSRSSSLHLWKYSKHAPILIEENAWIGEFARICKGVTVGRNSIVAANAVVTKDVPADSIVAGNPARIVNNGGLRDEDEPQECEEYNKLKGWK